jgi:ankyrin repeat protein
MKMTYHSTLPWQARVLVLLACWFFYEASTYCGIDRARKSALEEAILLEDAATVRTILNAGTSANALDSDGEPLIVRAYLLGNHAISSELLTHGANAKSRSKNGAMGSTLVMIAMNQKRGDLIELAIRNGAEPEGFTPLMIAVVKRDRDLAQNLLVRGADVNAENAYAMTALSLAIPDRALVRLLLDNGAKHHFSKFQVQCMLNETNAISNYLREPKVGSVAEKASGLYWAILFNSLEAVKILKQNGAADALPDWSFRTPVGLAAEKGYLELLKFLVASGADVNAKNEGAFTPLMLAHRHHQTTCVEFLLPLSKNKSLSPEN